MEPTQTEAIHDAIADNIGQGPLETEEVKDSASEPLSERDVRHNMIFVIMLDAIARHGND